MRPLVLQMQISVDGFVASPTYWPSSNEPVAAPMNEIPKAVFSRSGGTGGAATTQGLVDAALFADLPNPLDLTLVSATPFPGGIVAHVYRKGFASA